MKSYISLKYFRISLFLTFICFRDHLCEKIKNFDAPDDGLPPQQKSLFSYSEFSQPVSKKWRVDIMNEIKEEIAFFLKDSCYVPTLVFDRKNQFPYLYRLKLRTLCITTTSALVERIFSKSWLIMTPHRSRLATNTLSDLTFFSCNLGLLE